MKKTAIFSLLIIALLLTGCTFKLPFNKTKPSGEEIGAKDSTSTLEGIFLIAEDDEFLSSPNYSEELSDAYIVFAKDNSFYAYLGFANTILGTYTISNNIITCDAKTFANDYSPTQNISASITFNYDDAILTVIDASPSYHIKTTNIDEDGNWIFDGGEKDMPLTVFSKGVKYTLYMPINY